MNFLDLAFITAEQFFLHIPVAFGAYMMFVLLKLPLLSLEVAYVFGALLGAKSTIYTDNLSLAMISGFAGGVLVGVTIYLIYYLTEASLLFSNIITIGLFHGINQIILNKGIHISLHEYTHLLSLLPSFMYYPNLTTLFFIAMISIILFYIFSKTPLYLCFKIYGNNTGIFDHYKISRNYIEITSIIIGCGLAGTTGILISLHNGFADISMGSGIILLCLMTLILGKLFFDNDYNFSIVLIGLICYFIIQQSLLHISFDTRYFMMMRAFLITILLFIMNKLGRKDSYELGL